MPFGEEEISPASTAEKETKGIGGFQVMDGFKVVGTRPIRHDGVDKVTGRARYGADINLTGLLHGKILRSPHAHARIRSIDTSKALALPGVKAVVTAQDLPIIQSEDMDLGNTLSWGHEGNNRMVAENVLAQQKVLYQGHAVAGVAATSPHIAEEALKLIQVDYEVLSPVLTVQDAMREDAPLLHEALTTRDVAGHFDRGQETLGIRNVGSHIQYKLGDVEQGFKEASVIVEGEFTTQMVHQGYIEPHISTVFWAHDGHLTIWTSTQDPFGIRAQTAAILEIPESMVKVIPMEIGGGFGGKVKTYLDPVAGLLSRASGQPVKIAMSRKEVFEATGPTSGTYIRVKMGADRRGRITAAQFYLAYEAGAFPGSPVASGAMTPMAPYKVANQLIDGYDVVCNKPRSGAYRAPGRSPSAFASETVIDELAEKLGMDPLEFRLKNAAKEGDRLSTGVPHPRVGFIEVMEEMQTHPHYNSPLEGPNRGRGVAIGYHGNGALQSSATVSVNPNGSISLVTGSVDIGGSRAVLAMQAAEVLGVAAEDVAPSVGDTDSVGWTEVTGGSRVAFSTGIAVIAAAAEVKHQMMARAALLWEVQPGDVLLEDGVFVSALNPEDRITFKELAGKLHRTGGPVTASASSSPRQGGPTIAGNIVDVEVDPETGKVNILRYTAFQDVGKAIHPSYVEGQIQGGVAQGIGWALNEEYFYTEDGTMANSSFLDYRMPTCLDLPMIEAVIVEVPNPGHPFGVRGVGEVNIVPPMAAIANAIYSAAGVRMNRLPMSPGAVLDALEARDSHK